MLNSIYIGPHVLYVGDCIEAMNVMQEASVHTCVTSPPYYGLRDYGVDGQIGLEPTPDEYVAKMVDVFRSVRRVLCDDGTVWLNLGDSYTSQGGAGQPRHWDGREKNLSTQAHRVTPDQSGLKHKDLIGIPWRVAFALQADGWYLRQDIIWHKPNPMPESVTDRCTKAHEYLFLLSKSARYYFDAGAIQEKSSSTWNAAESWKARQNYDAPELAKGADLERMRTRGFGTQHGDVDRDARNRRSVWTVTTKPFPGAHFATFPPDLIEPCILAGSPEGGVVLDPFTGSGTTGIVAEKHGRRFIGCELNPEYAKMAHRRIAKETEQTKFSFNT